MRTKGNENQITLGVVGFLCLVVQMKREARARKVAFSSFRVLFGRIHV
jgi:hypothetical protein